MMAAATAGRTAATAMRTRTHMALWVIGILCLLYIGAIYSMLSNPDVRALGFDSIDSIRALSFLIFVLFFIVALYVENRAPRLPMAGAQSAARGPPNRADVARANTASNLKDPGSRPGAPPPMDIPKIRRDALDGGWQRWKFPAERTGGIYHDTDMVVDDTPEAQLLGDGTARGLMILRVREEVARVCVSCALIEHCHSKVRTIITRAEMRQNFECVPGLRKMVEKKMAAVPVPAVPEAPTFKDSAPAPEEPAASEAAAAPAPEADGAPASKTEEE